MSLFEERKKEFEIKQKFQNDKEMEENKIDENDRLNLFKNFIQNNVLECYRTPKINEINNDGAL